MSKSPRKKRLLKILLAACVTLVALKVADVALGLFRDTPQRHLLRLPAHASFRHQSNEFDYEFHANSLGLRGPEIPRENVNGAFRVAVVGDSFVAGFGVADDQVLTVPLAERLNQTDAREPKATAVQKVEVINLGRTGSSTIRELDVYEYLGKPFHPDVLVLMYFLGNDLIESVQEHDRRELGSWKPPGMLRGMAYTLCPNAYLELALIKQSRQTEARLAQRPESEILASLDQISRQHGVDPQEARKHYEKLPSEVRKLLTQGMIHDQRVFPACYDPERFVRTLDPEDDFFRTAWGKTERHLDLLKRSAEEGGARFVLVAIPDALQVDPEAFRFTSSLGYTVRERWLTESCRTEEALRAWSEKNKVPYLDLTERFRESGEKLYYPEDDHFNPAGHAAAARILADFLREEKLLSKVNRST